MYRSYHYLRPLTVFAGIIGIVQSLTWIGMAITGLVAYYCHMDLTTLGLNLGSAHAMTFFHIYFNGSCAPLDFEGQYFDTSVFDNLDLMPAQDVHAFMWVYLIISFFWLISSIIIIIYVVHEYLRFANIFLYIWIIITLIISVIDLGLGIIFGIDFGIFQDAANQILVSQQLATQFTSYFLLLTGQTVSGIMMTVCYRGFLLWVINVALAIYLFTETFKIHDYNKMKSGFSNPGFMSDTHTMHRGAPIDAYGMKHSGWNSTPNTFGYPHPRDASNDRRQTTPQRRHEDDEVQMRRDPSREVVRELNDRNSYNQGNPRSPRIESTMQMPAPDYSPPMPRANPFESRPPLRSALRASRY